MRVELKGLPTGRSFKAAGGLETINWHIETPAAKVYYPVARAERALMLVSLRAFTLTGSGTITVAINDTPVGDLTDLAVDTNQTDTDVTPAVSVPEGATVTLEVTDLGDMADLIFAISFQ